MGLTLKLPALAFGAMLGMAALPTAYSDMESGMTVLMRSAFVVEDKENIKWERNMATPWGMRTVMLYGDPTKPGPYVFRAKMPSGKYAAWSAVSAFTTAAQSRSAHGVVVQTWTTFSPTGFRLYML